MAMPPASPTRPVFPCNAVLDALSDGVLATDTADRLIVYVNDAACELTGYARDELLGRSPKLLQGPDTDPAVLHRLRADLEAGLPFNGQGINYRKDGTSFVMEWSISHVADADGSPAFYVAVQRDATLPARRLLNAERDAHTDALTGLPNRTHLDRVVESTTWLSARARSALVIDLDHFKLVNDTHGHLVGDEVLRLFARRLSGTLRGEDLVARWGGEEFCVITPSGHAIAGAIAHRIVHVVAATPFQTAAGELDVTASVGIASISEKHSTVLELLQSADRAMYVAKRRGRNRVERL